MGLGVRSAALVSAWVTEDALRKDDERLSRGAEIAVPAQSLVGGATERSSQPVGLLERSLEFDERPRQRLPGVGVPVVGAGDPSHGQHDALEARLGPQALGDEYTCNRHVGERSSRRVSDLVM